VAIRYRVYSKRSGSCRSQGNIPQIAHDVQRIEKTRHKREKSAKRFVENVALDLIWELNDIITRTQSEIRETAPGAVYSRLPGQLELLRQELSGYRLEPRWVELAAEPVGLAGNARILLWYVMKRRYDEEWRKSVIPLIVRELERFNVTNVKMLPPYVVDILTRTVRRAFIRLRPVEV
jgi:hypothetical protein